MRRNSLIPRPIKPELIVVGDEISVQYPEDGGVTVTKRGVVDNVEAHAGMRYILTAQGGVLAVWQPGKPDKLTFTLEKRATIIEPMLDMFTELGRLA